VRASSRALTGVVLFVTSAICGCGMSQGVDQAKKSADEFHARFNAKQFDTIYDAADPEWRKTTDRDTSTKFFSRVQRKMGVCTTSTSGGYNYNVTTSGTFVTIDYQTTCANGKLDEEFRWRVDGKKTLLLAYNANSPLLLTD
jgi:hypothetical protein